MQRRICDRTAAGLTLAQRTIPGQGEHLEIKAMVNEAPDPLLRIGMQWLEFAQPPRFGELRLQSDVLRLTRT